MLALAAITAGCVAPAEPADPRSPYVGEETRPIKALTAEEVEDLLSGRGMGLAKAAELNGYPGPLHVLDLADELRLSAEQKATTERLRATMRDDAVRLGREVVTLEGRLEAAFAEATIDEARVADLTGAIAVRMGELRAVHLDAHVRLRPVLTDEQVARYDTLRGYAGEDAAAGEEYAAHAGHGG